MHRHAGVRPQRAADPSPPHQLGPQLALGEWFAAGGSIQAYISLARVSCPATAINSAASLPYAGRRRIGSMPMTARLSSR